MSGCGGSVNSGNPSEVTKNYAEDWIQCTSSKYVTHPLQVQSDCSYKILTEYSMAVF